MVLIGFLGSFLMMFFSWKKIKDPIAPPFIISAIWLLMYIIMLIRNVDFYSIYYISFFVGLVFFVIGFYLVVGNKNKNNYYVNREKKSNLIYNPFSIKVLLFVFITIFILYTKDIFSYISANFSYNFWLTLNTGRKTGAFNDSFIFSYSSIAILAFTIVSSIVYFNNPNKRNKKYFYISLILSIFFTVTGGNRGIIFMLVIGVFFSNIIIKNYNNKKTIFILLIAVAIILAIFIVFSFLKYVYEDQSNPFVFIMKQLRIYFSTSTLAFVQWADSNHDYVYGANTFRFLLAILDKIGYKIEVPRIVQEFIWVNGDLTNVYTVLHYYAMDFGLIYAFIIQLLLGMIHGFFYKKAVLFKGSRPFFIGIQSLLYFPLIYQFFDDRYFSIFSIWIQLMFWIWLFSSKLFLKVDSV